MKLISLKYGLLVSFALTLTACGPSQESTPKYPSDVFIRSNPSGLTSEKVVGSPTGLGECRAHIAQVLCLSVPAPPEGENLPPGSSGCLPDNAKYIKIFEAHFDRAPDYIKRMYCGLDAIRIEESLSSTAYSSPEMDANGRMLSGTLGIRREVLDSEQNLDDLLTWKEETSYGGSKVSSAPHLGVLLYRSNRATHEAFIDYILNHEFGHLFDFANNLNQNSDCHDSTGHGCPPAPGSWGEFSWKNYDQPKDSENFPLRDSICFYNCMGNFLKADQATLVLAGLMNSNFASAYAATNPMDDFAESFALFIFHEDDSFDYGISADGQYFHLSDHFRSAQLQAKRSYIETFLRGNIRYPGQQSPDLPISAK